MVKSGVIVIDLDGTICFPNLNYRDSYNRYALAAPNQPIIEKMQTMNRHGWEFIISTARRMVTHNGDVTKIIEDVGDITYRWLAKYQVPYKELQFGKPYGDYYVDDKACGLGEFISL